VESFEERVVQLAIILERVLTKEQVVVYSGLARKKLSFDEFNKSTNIYLEKNLSTRPANELFAVTISKIIDIAKPKESREDFARLGAQKIITAIRRYGRSNPKDARKFMGEVEWDFVSRRGGWETLCLETRERDIPILNAQLRDGLGSLHNRIEKGLDRKENPFILGSVDIKTIT